MIRKDFLINRQIQAGAVFSRQKSAVKSSSLISSAMPGPESRPVRPPASHVTAILPCPSMASTARVGLAAAPDQDGWQRRHTATRRAHTISVLMNVIGDERDLIGLRTNHRRDHVYLYPIRTTPEKMRRALAC